MNSTANRPDPEVVASLLADGLRDGKPAVLTVISNSMAPLIQTDDEVVLQAADLDSLNKGDIITLKSREGFLTHRVVSRSIREVRTRGDRNIVLDLPVQFDQIIGRVVQIKSKRLGKTIDLDVGWGRKIGKLIYQIVKIEIFVARFTKLRRLSAIFFGAVIKLLMRIL